MMAGKEGSTERKQWRDGERGAGRRWGGIKTDRDRERMCEEVCVSERASECV